MPGSLLESARQLRDLLGQFDPALLSAEDSVTAVHALIATEKACAAARARVAARAVDQGAHRADGFASGGDWLARYMGSTSGEARMALETAATIESCPQVKEALINGEVSLAQAQEIARSQPELPGAAQELVDLARRSGLTAVRDVVRDRILRQADPDELYRRRHRHREFRHWRDREGMVRFSGALTPGVGIPIVNRLEIEADRLRRAAHRAGQDEPFAAYAADALVAMLSGSGRGSPTRSELILVCDLNAYRRGHADPGEVCQIVGGGPIPVSELRQLSQDAFLKVVLHDGVRIDTVKHFGRHISAELRTALEIGAPPEFDGVACVEADCGRHYGLEWDHVDPVANRGPTSYDNLQPRCKPHHREKTERDRRAGLLGRAPP